MPSYKVKNKAQTLCPGLSNTGISLGKIKPCFEVSWVEELLPLPSSFLYMEVKLLSLGCCHPPSICKLHVLREPVHPLGHGEHLEQWGPSWAILG